MRSITRSKDIESVLKSLEKYSSVYVIGCGTCATMCKTGGLSEVLAMADVLKQNGKSVAGWTVIPTACDILSHEIIKQEHDKMDKSDVILEMSCGIGNQQIAAGCDKPVLPANDTISMGREFPEGNYISSCMQCGECLLGSTASICPMVICPKSMGNGPCGGTDNGKCEVDKNKDCAWTLIYNRLEAQGRLDDLRKYQPPKNYQKALEPVLYRLEEE
jgi:hypothetical protein